MDGGAGGESIIRTSRDDDDATERSNVLSLLSFTASDVSLDLPFSIDSRTMSGRHRLQRPATSMQGVLWKRRDVFRNRWRPRWFVLHPQQGILTYYLLNGNLQSTAATANTMNPGTSTPNNRRRADSDISMDTMDYEVVPRGSIFLGNASCTVEANEELTRPEERLYALTISDRESRAHCHLASRTSTARDRWLEKIQEAITQHQMRTSQRSMVDSDESSQTVEPPAVSAPTPTPILEEEPKEQIAGLASPGVSSVKWFTVPFPDLTKGVPATICAKINSVLETNLPFVTDENHPDFKLAYEDEGVKVSNHKTLSLLRSIYTTLDHHPSDYLPLVWDSSRATELEPNVRTQETLRVLNKNTSIVYTTYHSVWPTKARDFCSVIHWRLMQNSLNDAIALCVVAFSCPEATKLMPVDRHHVRGTLNVSLHFWKPMAVGGCIHSRVLSFDMHGKLPKQLVQTIMQQQATFPPRAMDTALKQVTSKRQNVTIPTLPSRMDYESMLRSIAEIKHRRSPELRQLQPMIVPSSNAGESSPFESAQSVNVFLESLVLLTPLAVQQLLLTVGLLRVEVLVVPVAMFFCVRWVLLQQLLCHSRILPKDKSNVAMGTRAGGGATLCRLSMNIKTILTFLDNEREAQVALGIEDLPTLEFNHVLLRSISKAMQKHPALLARTIPFLPPLYNLEMQWHRFVAELPLRIPSAQQGSIQSIADLAERHQKAQTTKEHSWFPKFVLGPSCQVWTSAERVLSQESGCTISSRVVMNANGCPISILLQTACASTVTNGDKRQLENEDSTLDLLFSFQTIDRALCESFVREVQKLLQFPELCDA